MSEREKEELFNGNLSPEEWEGLQKEFKECTEKEGSSITETDYANMCKNIRVAGESCPKNMGCGFPYCIIEQLIQEKKEVIEKLEQVLDILYNE